jgi:hypothetical protein
MSSNSTTSTENKSSDISETKPREMTVDEYAELVAKWQQTYYAWNTSFVTYYKYIKIDLKNALFLFFLLLELYFSMIMLNSTQQFFQQIPVLTSANLLSMLTETNRSPPFDPLAEIRNGLNIFLFEKNFFLKVFYF